MMEIENALTDFLRVFFLKVARAAAVDAGHHQPSVSILLLKLSVWIHPEDVLKIPVLRKIILFLYLNFNSIIGDEDICKKKKKKKKKILFVKK